MNQIPEALEFSDRLRYLSILQEQFPTKESLYREISMLNAIISLPKGTEHFMSDIHGEHEAFRHILNNCSGVIREKAEALFTGRRTPEEIAEFLTLIYYPEDKLTLIHAAGENSKEWYTRTLLDLTDLARMLSSKYTRSRVRRALPEAYGDVIDEMLHAQPDEDNNQVVYHQQLLNTIVSIQSGDDFIVALCTLVKRLAVAALHIVGDIFDRGPRSDYVMDQLMAHPTVDIEWGNHDILWMGAACGNDVCIAAVVRNSLQYDNMTVLESGYGVSLRELALFAEKAYPTKSRHDAMLQAIAVILFKLEGQLISRHPDYGLDDRKHLHLLRDDMKTLELDHQVIHLKNTELPTLNPDDPYALSDEEQAIMADLHHSFRRSERLSRHVRFLYENGGMFRCCNGNLLFHGCIPMTESGDLAMICLGGDALSGKHLMIHHDQMARKAWIDRDPSAIDFMWYLWCAPRSPLCGRELKTFERHFFQEKSTWQEPMNPYYVHCHTPEGCMKILQNFGLHGEDAHIINGHTPVHVSDGESPVKADGKLIVIDGGFCRAYQKTTGIAGYTLISNSHGLRIVAHHPFSSRKQAVRMNDDILSDSQFICRFAHRAMMGDTDEGIRIKARIRTLTELLEAYRNGTLEAAKM